MNMHRAMTAKRQSTPGAMVQLRTKAGKWQVDFTRM